MTAEQLHSPRGRRILAIARRLRATIPPGPVAQAKKQKSWATLTPGRWLENMEDIKFGTRIIRAGETWEVTLVNSLGATLLWVGPADGEVKTIVLHDKAWKKGGQWKTKRKTKKGAGVAKA